MAGTVCGGEPGEKAVVTQINRCGQKFTSVSRVAHEVFSEWSPRGKIIGSYFYPELSG
jgi:hypothetical protein